MSTPNHDHWVRCDGCECLYLVEYKPTKLQKNQYSTKGCQVCRYRWLRETTINSMHKMLKKGFLLIKKNEISDWRELAPVIFGIYRTSDPVFVRECFKEASIRFELHFNRMWERSLQ